MDGIRRKILDLETILLGIFFVITAWILIGSLSLNSEASKLFPQMTAGIVLILFMLLFVSKALPDKLQDRLPEQNTLTYGEDEAAAKEFDERYVVIVFLMFGAFIIGAYILGLFVAVPVYVYTNLHYFEYGSRRRRLAIIIITLIIVSISYEIFRIPPSQGVLPDLIL